MPGRSHAVSEKPAEGPPQAADARVRTVVSEHHAFAWRLLRRLGVAEADADDAVQRVFLVVLKRLPDIEAGRERAFVVSTAVRVAADARRSAKRRPLELLPNIESERDPAALPDALVESYRARRLLDAILDDMPEDARSVFVLFEIEELTLGEIASALTIPRGTVASRLARGRAWFSAELTKRHGARKDDDR
jgi:RNA polymerase sigma-70 factor (ECF subfamily)